MYVFLLALDSLHVFMSHDTWFITWVILGLLHLFLLTLVLLHVFPISHDTWFIAWVTLSVLHALLLTFGVQFRRPSVQMTGSFAEGQRRVELSFCHFKRFVYWRLIKDISVK